MRIVCVGGGPLGLYFALLMKRRSYLDALPTLCCELIEEARACTVLRHNGRNSVQFTSFGDHTMHTMRFHAYQKPSRVQALLESLVQARELVPDRARKVIDQGELPSRLQKLIFQALKSGRVWSAWIDGELIWLFVAELSLAPSRERGCPALQVSVYRENGKIKDWQEWARLNDGTWQPCGS